MPSLGLTLLVVIGLAVTFDFINGFHDTANAVATVISTRVMRPWVAITMAGILNFVGALAGTEVAKTVGSGIVGTTVPLEAIAAALSAAIAWNLITWYRGIPSSSSHALVGSLLGAGIASLGLGSVHWVVLWGKVGLPLLVSPVVGFLIALWLMRLLASIFGSMPPARVGPIFRRTQIVSAAFMAFSHGSNDAQKTMGIITLALVSGGILPSFHVPTWVIARWPRERSPADAGSSTRWATGWRTCSRFMDSPPKPRRRRSSRSPRGWDSRSARPTSSARASSVSAPRNG